MARINPYTRLLNEIKEHCRKVKYRRALAMFFYAKKDLKGGWSLVDVYERTAAANKLGYDVILSAEDDGLHMKYIKKVPETPYEWQ